MATASTPSNSQDCTADSSSPFDASSLNAAIHEAVSLLPHDPVWADAFALERNRLQATFPGAFLAIEHIGSTAVPGLVAKPVIDILAALDSLDDVEALMARLCDNGYTTSVEFNATLTDRKWLMRWRDGRRTHHLHLVVAGGQPWNERIRFRDALRTRPDLLRRYAELKTALAIEFRNDRERYTEAKSAFVTAVLEATAR